MEHADLNVDTDGFLDKTTLLVKLGCLRPLFHLLAYTSNLNDQVLVRELLGDLHSSGHASHLDGCTSNTGVALGVVLLHIDTLVTHLGRRVHVCALIKLLCLSSVALVFDLGGELAADELLSLRCD